MTTLAPLHRRLRLALDLSSLLVLGALVPGCAATQDQDPTQAKTPPSVDPPQPEPRPEPIAKVDPPEPKPEPIIAVEPRPELPRREPPTVAEVSLPRCPTIAWCGTKPLAEAMRSKDFTPPPDVEGCPGLVDQAITVDAKLRAGQEPPPAVASNYGRIDAAATKQRREAGDTEGCCYEWTIPCPGGRPWLAGLRPGRGLVAALPEAPCGPALPVHVRERIADAWLRDALAEHASIASFARARAELAAIAAPPALLEACERAADDEVEHARLCFALAERWSGRSLEPTALPEVRPRSSDPLTVALDTFVEGCVGETIAAACAREAARLATDPVARAVLERIADDETEHAALAWRTIAWLVQREGQRVLAALEARAHALRPRPSALPPSDPEAEVLFAHGRLDARALQRTRVLAWRELVDPLLAELHGPGVTQRDLAVLRA